MLVDSHCHLDRLDLTKYHDDLGAAIAAANDSGVDHFLCPGITLASFAKILAIAEKYQNVMVAVGTHPTEDVSFPTVKELVEIGANSLVAAVGETGLDYFYCKDEQEKENQRQLFKIHIQAAKELQKPLIIHSRLAAQDIVRILQEEQAASVGGVMHCYTENFAMAEAAMELNFLISFSGIITFKNADALRAVAKKIPLDKMLIETDAPYLAPVPMRGKPNEPAFLHYTAEYLAKYLGLSLDDFAGQTTENYFRFLLASCAS